MELSPELILPSHFKIMWHSAINLLPVEPSSNITEWVRRANVLCNSGAIHARLKFVRLLLVQFWPFLCHERSGVIRERSSLSLSRHYVAWWKLELDTALLLASYWAGETVKTTERRSFQGKHWALFPPRPSKFPEAKTVIKYLVLPPNSELENSAKNSFVLRRLVHQFPAVSGS